jgi:hypothetical protein
MLGQIFEDKFRVMLDMRERVEASEDIPPNEMRRLAARFPGVLRELEMTETDELVARAQRFATATGRARGSAWVLAQARYHALWSLAIAYKSGSQDEMPTLVGTLQSSEQDILRKRLEDSGGRSTLNDWILAHAGAPLGWGADRVRSLFDGRARVSDPSLERGARDAIGLCRSCLHHRTSRNARGSEFHLCARAQGSDAWRKYPPLPVVGCAGHDLGPAK